MPRKKTKKTKHQPTIYQPLGLEELALRSIMIRFIRTMWCIKKKNLKVKSIAFDEDPKPDRCMNGYVYLNREVYDSWRYLTQEVHVFMRPMTRWYSHEDIPALAYFYLSRILYYLYDKNRYSFADLFHDFIQEL